MSLTFATFVLGVSTALWAFVAIFAQYQKRILGAISRPTILLAVLVCGWTLAYAFEVGIANPQVKYAAHHLKYAFMVLVPVIWLWFALSYADAADWLTRRRLLLYAAIPLITLALVATDFLHHLMWSHLQLVDVGDLVLVSELRAPWGWIYTVYSYYLFAFSSLKMLRSLNAGSKTFRKRYFLFLLVFVLPAVTNVIYVLGVSPVDFTPYALAISGIGVAWNLFSYRLIDLAPLAHNIVTESMSDGMMILDADNKIFSVNLAAQQILGGDGANIIGKKYETVLFDLMRSQSKAGGFGFQTTGQIPRMVNGEQRYLEMRMSPLRDQAEKMVGRVIIIRDITKRKEAEDKIKAALDAEKELNVLRARFVSIVSHEFRVPMSTIQMTAEMIQRYGERMDAQTTSAKLDTIIAQITLMNALIDDVLSVDRLQTGSLGYKPENLPVIETVRELVGEMTMNETIAARVEFEAPATDVTAPVDKRLVRLAIRNLVSNGLKYSPQDQPVKVKLESEGTRLHIEISDRGIGIPERDRAHLFDAFYRAGNVGDTAGSGLGLMIAKQAIEMHGGSIHFTSTEEVGTTFHLMLPLNGKLNGVATQAATAAPPPQTMPTG